MHISHTIQTAYGPGSIGAQPMVPIRVTRNELHLLVRAIERAAAEAETEGRLTVSDRLAWRAAGLKEAAR